MRPKVRPMTDKDKPAVIQMLRDIPEFKSAEIDVAEEVINSYLADPIRSGYHIFVAEASSSIAGYICYGPTPLTEGTWDIYWRHLPSQNTRQQEYFTKHKAMKWLAALPISMRPAMINLSSRNV